MIELKGTDKEIVQALKEFANRWHTTKKKESAFITNEQLFNLLSVVCMEQFERDRVSFENELTQFFEDMKQGIKTAPKPKGEA